eukprot:8978296-Alexandrium_andersonii.AAC.1
MPPRPQLGPSGAGAGAGAPSRAARAEGGGSRVPTGDTDDECLVPSAPEERSGQLDAWKLLEKGGEQRSATRAGGGDGSERVVPPKLIARP